MNSCWRRADGMRSCSSFRRPDIAETTLTSGSASARARRTASAFDGGAMYAAITTPRLGCTHHPDPQEGTMKYRLDDPHGERVRHPGQHAPKPPHYAGARDDEALYDGLPSVTNRAWDEDRANDATSYGHPGQGGYGESQGAHAQSGHGRGGAQFAGRRDGDRESLGLRAGGHRGRGPRGYQR